MIEAGEFPIMVAGYFNEPFKVAWAISEEILFGKRIDKKRLSERYGVDINQRYNSIFKHLEDNHLIEENSSDSCALTHLGLFWAHNIGALFQSHNRES
jgi:coproporphyrinogen III oxidase-like Fe-S oxidoreductase